MFAEDNTVKRHGLVRVYKLPHCLIQFAKLDVRYRICRAVMIELLQKFVAGMPLRHHKMARERRFSRTHCPYVQIVYCINTGVDRLGISPHLLGLFRKERRLAND